MSAITGIDVVSQISEILSTSFPNEITTVYINTPMQDMEKPCFFIQQITTSNDKQLRKIANRRYFMDIRVHPAENNDTIRTWLYDIGDRLFTVLNYITISGQRVYGRNMRFEITDNVLHFFVDYSFRVTQLEDEGIKMRTLETDEYINYYGKL